jgi:hypothetical protein
MLVLGTNITNLPVEISPMICPKGEKFPAAVAVDFTPGRFSRATSLIIQIDGDKPVLRSHSNIKMKPSLQKQVFKWIEENVLHLRAFHSRSIDDKGLIALLKGEAEY